jgi:hypothetical protein
MRCIAVSVSVGGLKAGPETNRQRTARGRYVFLAHFKLPSVARTSLVSVVIGTSTAARNSSTVPKTKIARSAVATAAGDFAARPGTTAGKFLRLGDRRERAQATEERHR